MDIVDQAGANALGEILKRKLLLREKRSRARFFDNFYVVAAYVRSSGVRSISPALGLFRKRRGKVFAAVGVDNGNTSVEGLKLLNRNVDVLYIFNDDDPFQSFHPKLYVLEKTGKVAFVVVGSSNLTGGGMYTNYELSTTATYDLTDRNQRNQFSRIMKIIRRYTDTKSPLCKKYGNKLLQDMKKRGMLSIERLDKIRRNSFRKRNRKGLPPLFGTQRHRRPPSAGSRKGRYRVQRKGFWKALSSFDVSRRDAPGQIQIPLEFLRYFPPIDNYRKMPPGSQQGDVYFDVIFKDPKGRSRLLRDVRAVVYIPAPQHKRKNQELRFTFLDRSVSNTLRKDDILEFNSVRDSDVWFRVSRLPKRHRRGIHSRNGQRSGVLR